VTVLTTESIAQSLQTDSATNGWDAVFAMNLKQVNALFFQQFLDIGPTNTRAETFLRCALADESSLLVLDAGLGPPELYFQTGDAKTAVEMELIAGVLITIDQRTMAIKNAAWLRPNESKLTGSLELAKVRGEVNQVGKVVMDLGASAYTPTIGGVNLRLNTKIGDAVRTYFRENAAAYTMGIIGNDTVSPSLTPTSFLITTQKHPTRQDSCVLVLIQTNGQPGTVGPLATYPIPDDCGAALLIAERPLFNALADDLNKRFQPFGTNFSARNDSKGWSCVGGGGHIDCGAYGAEYSCWPPERERAWEQSSKIPWTSDERGHSRSVQFGLDGITISAANGRLVATWNHKHSQHVSQVNRSPGFSTRGGNFAGGCGVITAVSVLQADFNVSGAIAVDAGSSKVSFNFSNPTLNIEAVEYPSWVYRLFGATAITSEITNTIKRSLQEALNSVTAVSIDAFRLKCLLFQSPDTVKLTGAKLPRGGFLTGNAAMPLSVTPASTSVQPGGSVQFSAAGLPSSDIFWEIEPRDCGSINHSTGLYTVPHAVPLSSARVVVVTAIQKSKTAVRGSAMALVYRSPAEQGVAILPGRSLVTQGHHVKLYATDRLGAPLNVSWMLSPNVGSIAPGLQQGEYIYTAPSQLSGVTEVTASAQTHVLTVAEGTAVIQLVPSTGITVNPVQGSVKFGARLALMATVYTGDPGGLRWVVYPSGSGKVEFDPGDPTRATYIAPASITHGNQVHVLAYLVNLYTAGLGSAVITLTP